MASVGEEGPHHLQQTEAGAVAARPPCGNSCKPAGTSRKPITHDSMQHGPASSRFVAAVTAYAGVAEDCDADLELSQSDRHGLTAQPSGSPDPSSYLSNQQQQHAGDQTGNAGGRVLAPACQHLPLLGQQEQQPRQGNAPLQEQPPLAQHKQEQQLQEPRLQELSTQAACMPAQARAEEPDHPSDLQHGQLRTGRQQPSVGQVSYPGSSSNSADLQCRQPEIVPLEEDAAVWDSSCQHERTATAATEAGEGEQGAFGRQASTSSSPSSPAQADDAEAMFNMFSTCRSNSFTTSCHTTQAGQKVLIVRAGASVHSSSITAVFVKEPTGEVWEAPVDQVTITYNNTPAAGAAGAAAPRAATAARGSGRDSISTQASTPSMPGLSAEAAAKLFDALNSSTANSCCSDVGMHAGGRCCSKGGSSSRRASSRGCSCEVTDKDSSSPSCSCFSSRLSSMRATGARSSISTNSSSRPRRCSDGCPGPVPPTASCHSCSSGACRNSCDQTWPAQQQRHNRCCHGPSTGGAGSHRAGQPSFWRRLVSVFAGLGRHGPDQTAAAAYLAGLDEAAHRAMRAAGCQSFLLPREWPENAKKATAAQRRLRVLLAAYKA